MEVEWCHCRRDRAVYYTEVGRHIPLLCDIRLAWKTMLTSLLMRTSDIDYFMDMSLGLNLACGGWGHREYWYSYKAVHRVFR